MRAGSKGALLSHCVFRHYVFQTENLHDKLRVLILKGVGINEAERTAKQNLMRLHYRNHMN